MRSGGGVVVALSSFFSGKYLSSNQNAEPHREVKRERRGIDGYVGKTPLVYLKTLSAQTGCHIYGKCEYMNPTGSVKGMYDHCCCS
jgi:tryptophan synthase beta subunit